MALTRRTPAFAQFAQRTEQLLQERGVQVPGEQVDAVINYRVEQAAAQMGVTARASLRYAPADLPESTAALILEVLTAEQEPAGGSPTSRGHLRLVEPAPGSPAAPNR